MPMKITLTSLLLLIGSFVYGQVITVKHAPADAPTSTTERLPSGRTVHTSMRGHFLLRVSELGAVDHNMLLETIGMTYTKGQTNQPMAC